MKDPSNRKRILVVEDDEAIRDVVRDFLESEEYLVDVASNGDEALRVLQTVGVPNLVLLDMKMPVMNGWQFALEFVNRYNHRAPIVVMTAAADAAQRATDVSAIGWVGKPFDLNELLDKIKAHQT